MSNTSATGGYLVPAPLTPPLEGVPFRTFLQAVVVGITGLPGNLVRPAWQPEPLNLPPNGTDWAAIRTTSSDPDTYAVVTHDPSGQGQDILQRHETVNMLVSFYGPGADSNAALLQDGLQIAQNREVLTLSEVALQQTQAPVTVPVLIKEMWYYRVDLLVIFKRKIKRFYPVLNVLSAEGSISTDSGIDFMFVVDSNYIPPI